MSAAGLEGWPEANQRYLLASLARVRMFLERHAARAASRASTPATPAASTSVTPAPSEGELDQVIAQAAEALPAPSALHSVCGAFGLSDFERDVLLLCAGSE